MRTRNTLLAVLMVAAVGLTGCASKEDTPSSDPSPSGTSTDLPDDAIVVTIAGDEVTPNGKRVEVSRGEDVVFRITSDAPGELHFHSTPEQTITFAKGSSTHILRFERPGVVEVESHELEKVVVQLEVR